jgi:hypothetical protein
LVSGRNAIVNRCGYKSVDKSIVSSVFGLAKDAWNKNKSLEAVGIDRRLK